jgi:hypothetical protein
MKNSKEYASKVKKLYASLKKTGVASKKVEFDDPIDAIVYATVSEYLNESATRQALKKIDKHFVDLNDLRVSRPEEVVDVLGGNSDVGKPLAESLKTVLNSIYTKYDVLELSFLTEIGKRQAKKDIEGMAGISNFVLGFCFMTSLEGHAIPLTEWMADYLKGNKLAHPDADAATIEGFLERQISAANGFEFYSLLRQECEKPGNMPKKPATKAKKATKKKAKKATKKKVAKKVEKVTNEVVETAAKKVVKKAVKKTVKKAAKKAVKKATVKKTTAKKATKKVAKKKTKKVKAKKA